MQSSKRPYYDISPEISEKTAVFPGDQPYQRKIQLGFGKGDHLGLSSIRTTVHIGAHADAPSHYHPKGAPIDARNLDFYFGPCQVISAGKSKGGRLTTSDIALTALKAPRVLFKTGSFPNPNRWTNDFNSLSPELIEILAKKKVKLIGIDTPSIDPWDSKKLESHRAVFKADMAILEGLTLAGVPDGRYQLMALPLRLKGADASPVRAVLVKQHGKN